MKSLWLVLVLICVASCRHVKEAKEGSVVEDEEAVDFDLFKESDPKFLKEQWQDLDIKDSDISPELREFLFWNFNAIPNKGSESEEDENDSLFKNSYEVSEEKGDIDSPLFLTGNDQSDLFKEKPSYDFESENNDESAENFEIENNDWLYPDYDDLFSERKGEKHSINKNVNMGIIQLQSFDIDEENNDKLPEEKVNGDWSLFPSGNDYDYFSNKLSEEKKDIDFSSNKDSNMGNAQLPFEQLLKIAEDDDLPNVKDDTPPEIKENDNWIQFPIEDDYDYFIGKLDKLNQEMKDMDTVDKKANIEITLLTDAKNKITIRVVSIQESDVVGNPEIADGKKGLVWETFPEGEYVDSNEYSNNGDFDNRVLTRRYFSRSSMFMVSTVLVVFTVMIFGFCLLCKLFKSKKKDSTYQPLNEEVV